MPTLFLPTPPWHLLENKKQLSSFTGPVNVIESDDKAVVALCGNNHVALTIEAIPDFLDLLTATKNLVDTIDTSNKLQLGNHLWLPDTVTAQLRRILSSARLKNLT